ncbi:MAG: rhodanese-like domain-containing protein [Bdellovibrionota bacterium]
MKFINVSFYKFFEIQAERLPELRATLREFCVSLSLKGTLLLAREGVNGFVAGNRRSIDAFKQKIIETWGFSDFPFKESESDYQPFTRMLVKIKKEIISMGVPEVNPSRYTAKRLSAQDLQTWFQENRDFVMLDTRNDYEVRIGTFERAIDMDLKTFRQFPLKLKELPADLRRKPVVTFCTGGIRCEKASALLEKEGFEDVYQLDGGILRYFEETGGSHYQGECFVFDQRVAVDASLNETPTVLCFNCQNPVTEEEQETASYNPPSTCPHCVNGKKIEHKERIAKEILEAGRTG